MKKIKADYGISGDGCTAFIEMAAASGLPLVSTEKRNPMNTTTFGTGEQIADALRKRIREKIGLTISVGVSFNKVYAKLGSDYKKPDATTVISKENYKDIVYPLPVRDLLFVGKRTAEILSHMGIKTIGELAQSDEKALIRLVRDKGPRSSALYPQYIEIQSDAP